jgi:hypothetical protein
VQGAQPVPELDELYDERTLAALDAAVGEPAATWEPRSARPTFAALVAGTVLGLQEVLDPRPEGEPVVELRPDPGQPGEPWVSFVHVVGAPWASRIVVRPWLAPSA